MSVKNFHVADLANQRFVSHHVNDHCLGECFVVCGAPLNMNIRNHSSFFVGAVSDSGTKRLLFVSKQLRLVYSIELFFKSPVIMTGGEYWISFKQTYPRTAQGPHGIIESRCLTLIHIYLASSPPIDPS